MAPPTARCGSVPTSVIGCGSPLTVSWAITKPKSQALIACTVPVAPARMHPDDVLFFNGQLVHGSFANRTSDRFRRNLIGHYIQGNAQQVAKYYHPARRFDGSQCGVWVTDEGKPVIEVVGYEKVEKATE